MNYFKYIINNWQEVLKTILNQCIILVWDTFDFILPEIIPLSPIREFVFDIFWKKGKNFYLRRGNRISNIGRLSFGNNCRMNRENLFQNGNMIIIGDGCRIGFRNLFLNANHVENGMQRANEKFYSKQIVIGKNVWITSNCTILPGTSIGDNVILSAGSVAKGRLESGWVYAGNPAVKVRRTKGVL